MKNNAEFPAVYIRFLDHSEGTPNNQGLVPCDVFGILSYEDSRAYYVTSWIAHNAIDNDNNVVFTISKSDVIQFTKLIPGPTKYPQGKAILKEFV